MGPSYLWVLHHGGHMSCSMGLGWKCGVVAYVRAPWPLTV